MALMICFARCVGGTGVEPQMNLCFRGCYLGFEAHLRVSDNPGSVNSLLRALSLIIPPEQMKALQFEVEQAAPAAPTPETIPL